MSRVWSPAPAATSSTRAPGCTRAIASMASVAGRSQARISALWSFQPVAACSHWARLARLKVSTSDNVCMDETYRGRPGARKPQARIAGAAKAHSVRHGSRLDWNDLRYFLAVARHGSTVAAARALATNQSTVQRRLTALERRIGKPLATRSPAGYRLTELGRDLVAHAEGVEHAVLAFEQQLQSATRGASGVLRIACPEPIVYRISQSALLERFK